MILRRSPRTRSDSPLLFILTAFLGGGFGILFGLLLRKSDKKAPALMPVALLTLLWELLPVMLVFLLSGSSSDAVPARTLSADQSAVPQKSETYETSEPTDPLPAIVEEIGPIVRSESVPSEEDAVPSEYDPQAESEKAAEELSRAEEEAQAAEEASRAEASREAEEASLVQESVKAEESSQAAVTSTTPEPPEEIVPRYVSVVAIGDMLMHPGVSGYAFQPDGSLNYDFCFDPIRDELISADIAVVNNEVPFGGNEFGLKNYPNFNVYQELGDAEVRAGFDVVLNATNHVRDMGTDGIFRTMNYWKNYPDVYSIGIHENAEDQDRIRVIERNGVRIAVLNYCYGINAGFPYDQPYLIDMMREEDKGRIAWDLQRAEELADFTIVFPHWGEEYQLVESFEQDRWAEFFTENGADLIIGTHPHVLEPIRWITTENGNRSLCYFSLGNYISLQDETMSVLGGMAKVQLIADADGVRVLSHDIQYLVTQYAADVSWAYVYKLENYSQELADCHGIKTANLPGNGLNEYYPFGIDTFYRIIAEVKQYSDPD